MNFTVKIITAVTLFLMVGCATAPSKIPPTMVSSEPYKNASCEVLMLELETEMEVLASLSHDQRNSRAWDITLNWLLLPGLGALTSDSTEEVGISKGKVEMLRYLIVEKC